MCSATIPTSVPFGHDIAAFLSPYGLVFAGDPASAYSGLTEIEISYAGQNSSDPDIIYRNDPGCPR